MIDCISAGTTVGKRYARTDELGVPFGITVDGQTLEDSTVTVRERDSTRQVTTSFPSPLSQADSKSRRAMSTCMTDILQGEDPMWKAQPIHVAKIGGSKKVMLRIRPAWCIEAMSCIPLQSQP